MLPIKTIYKIQNLRKDGTVKLYLQYCYTSDIHPLMETGISIPPKYWNKRKLWINANLPEDYGSAEAFISLILKKGGRSC